MVIIDSIFIIYFQKRINPYLNLKISPRRAIDFTCFAIVAASVVSIIADFINQALFFDNYSDIYVYMETPFPLLFATIFSCAIPAVFEEMAFRGFLFDIIEENSTQVSAWIVTSILFAIIHLSVIGLIWYIPLGFAAGYVRFKYKSIVYCMLLHFVYNFTITLIEYYNVV